MEQKEVINEVVLERKFNTGNYESVCVGVSKTPLAREQGQTSVSEMLAGMNREILAALDGILKRDAGEANTRMEVTSQKARCQ